MYINVQERLYTHNNSKKNKQKYARRIKYNILYLYYLHYIGVDTKHKKLKLHIKWRKSQITELLSIGNNLIGVDDVVIVFEAASFTSQYQRRYG